MCCNEIDIYTALLHHLKKNTSSASVNVEAEIEKITNISKMSLLNNINKNNRFKHYRNVTSNELVT